MHIRAHWLAGLVLGCTAMVAVAQDKDAGYGAGQASAVQAELKEKLSGATFIGTYLRDGSPYVMEFGADGQLRDNRQRSGRWWINEKGEYCREWTSGPHSGSASCLEILVHGARMALYSGNERLMDGELKR